MPATLQGQESYTLADFSRLLAEGANINAPVSRLRINGVKPGPDYQLRPGDAVELVKDAGDGGDR